MALKRLLIANRGEIAIRITRAARDLDIETVSVFSQDDSTSLHTRMTDDAVALEGIGVAPYLDIAQLVKAAKDSGCDAVHPGYGFLAESGDFARACIEAGLVFVGPSPEQLDLFGDKSRARKAAEEIGVPTVMGTSRATTLAEVADFFEELDAEGMIIKAIAGGGGRGTRVVMKRSGLSEAYERCRSEAEAAFGNGELYVEALIPRARHIEVQIVGDGKGAIAHLGERECSVQRRHQKIVEVAPAPNLLAKVRTEILDAAVKFAGHVQYQNLGTFEFLVNSETNRFAFIETNARLQVEHTVTEAVTGIDLVQAQLRLAGGESLSAIEVSDAAPEGFAIQARVNLETIDESGDVTPSGGTLASYDPPTGPGVRVDGFGYSGYTTSPNFDSLLAKVIVHTPQGDLADAAKRCHRALSEFRIEGASTNIPFLQAILQHEDFTEGSVYTKWIEDRASNLIQRMNPVARYFETAPATAVAGNTGLAGAQLNTDDPLAVFAHDRAMREASMQSGDATAPNLEGPNGSVGVPAPMQGTIVSLLVQEGDTVHEGQDLVVVEAMKMEHYLAADRSGVVEKIAVQEKDVVQQGHALLYIRAEEVGEIHRQAESELDLDHIRADLQEMYDRYACGLDGNRPDAVEKRRKTGQRTARENIDDLCDDGTFKEYGALVVAAQRRRRTMEWLRSKSPADGVICGIGTVNADLFPDHDARVMAMTYDYTVLAGTQGQKNHYKKERMFELARRFKLPCVLFAEGGGGRPGDVDKTGSVGMDVTTFTQWSKLSGLVPLVGIASGRCFAGNASLLGCADVVIATEDANIGMGGPAMIEGGRLGVFTPEEIGPMSVQVPNGVVDIAVKDEAEATAVAKKYLSYFQGTIKDWEVEDQRHLRHLVPETRTRMYNMRDVIRVLADKDSVLEIRKDFGLGMITAFVRIEGKPLGLIANNPHHLAGAIDAEGADKGSRFLQLCDAFDLPVISLMDCPGIMVGPEVEKTALVRHAARMFNTGANLSVPLFGIVVRKAYGLGVMTMCGAGSTQPLFTASWPTGEFAGMNIEGAVKLGFRNDLAKIEDPDERVEAYTKLVDTAYDEAKAVNAASFFGIDSVIDPAETRDWIRMGLNSIPKPPPREGKKRPFIDTW